MTDLSPVGFIVALCCSIGLAAAIPWVIWLLFRDNRAALRRLLRRD